MYKLVVEPVFCFFFFLNFSNKRKHLFTYLKDLIHTHLMVSTYCFTNTIRYQMAYEALTVS